MPVIDPTTAAGAANIVAQQNGQGEGQENASGVRSFQQTLLDAVDTTDTRKKDANASIMDTTTGGETSLHETMVAMEKSGVSMKLAVQVRNKAMEAYDKVMRMQI
ncbi:MAG: flagellar hook-basal body complex protein FliE [Thermodesulfobacteriota bacterium]